MLTHFTLILLSIISIIQADIGPFFRSISYEHAGYGKWPHQSYHSSETKGPILNIQKYDDSCDNGQYIFLSEMGSEVHPVGPIILDERGNLVWTSPYGNSWGFDVQTLNEDPHLTFCAWRGSGANVTCYILNSAYEEVLALVPIDGWGADGTEFQITKHNTAVLTTSKMISYDLTPVNGPKEGRMRDVGFQEFDLKTGDQIFQWSWSDHWDIRDVIKWPSEAEGSTEKPWDPFHINSVQKDSVGNYLISSRHTNTVGYVNGRTGDFIWKLGGKGNMFKDLSNGAATNISMQHHARFLKENSTITIFDNAVILESSSYQSKGKIIDINVQAMTAKVRQEYISPHRIGSLSRGSMQILENQHVLLGFGVNAGWAEYSMDGDLLCDVHFGPESRFGAEDLLSYRVLKNSWTGRPKTRPNYARKGNDVYVSWNGATEVAMWVLVDADTDSGIGDYKPFVSVDKEGFETKIPVPANLSTSSLRVIGVDCDGNFLGTTSVLSTGQLVKQTA